MPGRISEYIVAGPLLGTELLDVSQVDGLSITGYSTRRVTLDDIYDYVTPNTLYNANDSLTTPRTVDQDGNYLIFDNGSYFQIDGVNDGIYYEFASKKGAIGSEFPDAKWHVKGNAGQNSLLCEESTGIDTFWVDGNGKAVMRSTTGVENLELRSTGGVRTTILNNSNELALKSVGIVIQEARSTAGAYGAIGGYLSAANTYTPQDNTVEFGADYSSGSAIRYVKFTSIAGTETMVIGSSDSEGLRFDKTDVYSEVTQFYGTIAVEGEINIQGQDFASFNSGTGAFTIGDPVRVNDFVGTYHRFNGEVRCYDVRSTIGANTNYQMNQFGILFRADGTNGSDQIHFNMNVVAGASTAGSEVWKTGVGASDYVVVYGDGRVKMTALPTYADEAAAIVGGLATNMIYKTATGELRIKL